MRPYAIDKPVFSLSRSQPVLSGTARSALCPIAMTIERANLYQSCADISPLVLDRMLPG